MKKNSYTTKNIIHNNIVQVEFKNTKNNNCKRENSTIIINRVQEPQLATKGQLMALERYTGVNTRYLVITFSQAVELINKSRQRDITRDVMSLMNKVIRL